MIRETASDRHLRILAIVTGFGTAIFTLLALPGILEQAPHLRGWVFWPLTVLFCGGPLLLIPLGRWGSLRSIRMLARVHTIGAAVLLLAWAPAMLAPGLPGDRTPWLLNTMSVIAATAVIGWRGRVVWSYVILMCLGGAVLRAVLLGDGDFAIPIEDGFSMLSFSIVIAALLMVALAAGRELDASQALAASEARRAAESESTARQRARFGALVHDDVITTLLAAATTRSPGADIRRGAERALARLDQFTAPARNPTPLSAPSMEIEVRGAASEAADGVGFSGSLAPLAVGVPTAAAFAITGAVGEAMRNSVRHAGDAAHRTVLLEASARRLVVEVADDGHGFDPARVEPERLGIRMSIVERMAAIPGGSAQIESRPGRGTTVRLSWEAPA